MVVHGAEVAEVNEDGRVVGKAMPQAADGGGGAFVNARQGTGSTHSSPDAPPALSLVPRGHTPYSWWPPRPSLMASNREWGRELPSGHVAQSWGLTSSTSTFLACSEQGGHGLKRRTGNPPALLRTRGENGGCHQEVGDHDAGGASPPLLLRVLVPERWRHF